PVPTAASVCESVAIDQAVRGAATEREAVHGAGCQSIYATLGHPVDTTVRAPVRPSAPGAVDPAVRATRPGWPRRREPVRVETGDGGADGTLADLFQTVRFRAARAGVLGAPETPMALRLRLPGGDLGRDGKTLGLLMVE